MNCCTRSLRRPRRLLRCPPLLHTLELMRRRTPIQSATTGVVAHTRVLLAAAQRGSGVTSAGLWSGHRRSTSTLPPTFLHTSHNGPQGAAMEKVLPSLEAERTPASPSSSSLARRRDHTAALPTHFMFDPPFTPVDGEAARKGSVDACLYACRGCNSPVFCSSDLVHGSRVGHHSSGWPTFVAPLSNSAVRLRTVLQKSVVANLSDSPSSGTTKALRVHVPDAGMAQRGLAVEGDLVRLRGRRISEQHAQSWRETCLRDGNHRSDPAVVLGCCGRCGSPVCQVTQSAVVGSRFVSTAACVRVLGPKER
ncbi:putative mitochondrial hypothetical protein [Leptomonas pyrrhocoris]|uniref:Uncharacterized protein n=1 Tax=Leptomonas pyrrhocoris TaxID=157538 RepID=A0A0M9FSA5_LEPPY|nr:putative mitochondrial hypothetical protein [Leptomonas pyrrhocoris]XP_015653275.1 putative mitochondrial hypothetical protein [Leptomonas pyrrhocoris]KPA74835.1 putative mitochondrial hypothetical protein [Leptomonas pyrrhocoris]KPA74836.1 putative mitochondrial hypothetical protein [Leptomonas pyrrhocoris]|eukprot:XP_015653274.1 putative mitochondrial hypothetical protein [Leptomonas pyrrhocoris]